MSSLRRLGTIPFLNHIKESGKMHVTQKYVSDTNLMSTQRELLVHLDGKPNEGNYCLLG